jgi:hypothetical protein
MAEDEKDLSPLLLKRLLVHAKVGGVNAIQLYSSQTAILRFSISGIPVIRVNLVFRDQGRAVPGA